MPRWLSQQDLRDLALRLAHEFGGSGQFTPHGDSWWWVKVGKGTHLTMTVRHVSTGTLVRLEVADKPSIGYSIGVGFGAWVATAAALKLAGAVMTASIGGIAFGLGAAAYYVRLRSLRTSRNEARIREVLEASVGKLPLPPPSQSEASRVNKGA